MERGAGPVRFDYSGNITIIVNVDDKNCLVELTVAVKFNQGGQWPYIIAGVHKLHGGAVPASVFTN